MMKNDVIICYQVFCGNGGNLIVNDRILMCFIIVFIDVVNVIWMQVEGVGDGNGNLNVDFRLIVVMGCCSYKIVGDLNCKWCVFIQCEL